MIEIRNFTTFCNKGDMKGSDEGLTLETSDFKLFTGIILGKYLPMYVMNSVDNTKLPSFSNCQESMGNYL